MEPITDARELRVGQNYLYDGNIIKLDGSFLGMYLQNDTDLYLYPILLTEEILLERGFHESDFGYFILRYDDNDSYLSYKRNNLELCRGMQTTANSKIKYLHQLQNLYFALTGEELDIDLNG